MEEIKPMEAAENAFERLADAFGESWNDLNESKKLYIRMSVACLLIGMRERLEDIEIPEFVDPTCFKLTKTSCAAAIDLYAKEITEGK